MGRSRKEVQRKGEKEGEWMRKEEKEAQRKGRRKKDKEGGKE